ncbi:MAG: 30S ribosomal protein S7 [Planctomyces sp.]|nr:30S ribosomal protein S7 [Planctomyces sp.]
MAKSFTASAKQLKPDPRYGSELASKFINCMMRDGKKGIAMQQFYQAMDIIKSKVPDQEPIAVFLAAIDNVKPGIEVRSKRVGGATYQVPTQVNSKRQRTLAIRWILLAARSRKGRGIAQSLADELSSAAKREGAAVTTRENVHKMADANKAFAHFAY